MLSRFPDWPARLEVFLHENRSRKFKYGSWDCCLFVADAIQAMTGTDIAHGFRGLYRTRTEAMCAVTNYTGHRSVKAIVETLAKESGLLLLDTPWLAQRGDMVLIARGKRDHSLGIVSLTGSEILIAGRDSIGPVALARASQAWHV